MVVLRRDIPIIRFWTSREIPNMSLPTNQLLAGFKICDFTRVLSGPYCTRLLSDLGAEVYKIEKPNEGDEIRHIVPQMDADATDQSAYFVRVNAGK